MRRSSRMRRSLRLLLAATVAATIGAAAPSSARPGTPDNAAVVVNTREGAARSDFAFSLQRVKSRAVAPTNVAVARATCESCKTVAIAFQIVLAAGDPDSIAPVNRAIAVNDHCTHCDTLAAAYQFVVVTGRRAHLTPRGLRRLTAIRRQLGELARSELPVQDIRVRVGERATRVQSVLASELVVAERRRAACRSRGLAGTACSDR